MGTKEGLPALGRPRGSLAWGLAETKVQRGKQPGVASFEEHLGCRERPGGSACLTRGDGASVVEGQRPAGCGIGSSLEGGQPIKALMGRMISKVPGGKLD